MSKPSSDPSTASMSHLLHRAGQVADELFLEEMRGMDLTPRQFAVLEILGRIESASQMEIVCATGIDRSTLADIAKRLEQRRLIVRERSLSDARAYSVKLTQQGRQLLEAARPATARVEHRLRHILPEKRRDEFIDSLAMLASGIDNIMAQR